MVRLTDFGWQGFLGKFTPATVSRLGAEWSIPEWQDAGTEKEAQGKQDVKRWVRALESKTDEECATLVDYADQIKTIGGPEGRTELHRLCSDRWFEPSSGASDQELAALAFLERPELFREVLDWVQVLLTDRWEVYQAEESEEINLGKDVVRVLEEEIGNYWKDKALGKRCVVTPMHRGSASVIDIGYEQEPEMIREFADGPRSRKTVARITRPVREALLHYDQSTGALKVRMFRAKADKHDDLVRLFAEVCFENADLFPTGHKREARYDLSSFSTRPAFLNEDIDTSTGLERLVVVRLVLEPSYQRGSRVEVWIPAKQAMSGRRDVYDVLGGPDRTAKWRVMRVEMKAYFSTGRRKVLPIELRAKGGATRSGDPRYEIIDDHLRRWRVLK